MTGAPDPVVDSKPSNRPRRGREPGMFKPPWRRDLLWLLGVALGMAGLVFYLVAGRGDDPPFLVLFKVVAMVPCAVVAVGVVLGLPRAIYETLLLPRRRTGPDPGSS